MNDLEELIKKYSLTPQEVNKVLYHRSNLQSPGVDSEGYPVTIYATGIQIPEGNYKGQFVSVPGFVGGKIVEDEDQLWNIWKKDIIANKYPIYKTSKELNKRDKYLHEIMDIDMQKMFPQQEEVVNPFYADPFK